MRQSQAQYVNPAETMINIYDFFEKVDRKNGGDGIVWVRATAPQGMQVIIEPTNAQGKRIKVRAIKPGAPRCLSQEVGNFEILRTCEDLAQNVNNGNLKLLTSSEASAWFDKKAAVTKKSKSALVAAVAMESKDYQNSRPLADSEVDARANLRREDMVQEEDVVNPRLHDLASRLDVMLSDEQRISVSDVMSELLDMEEYLTFEDLLFLEAKGYYPTVKKWAQARQGEKARELGLEPETDELSETPAAE